MKRLGEEALSTWQDVKVLAFDVDDTLTRDGVLEAKAFAAMWRARDAGLHLIAVTGRPLGWAKVWSCQWPIDFAIGENGAGAFARGGALVHAMGDAEYTQQQLKNQWTNRFPDAVFARDQRERYCDIAVDIAEYASVSEDEIQRYFAFAQEVGASAARSSIHFHLQSARWEKGNALAELVRTAWPAIAAEQIVYVGDSPNDESAFAIFPLSVGVANVERCLPLLTYPPRFVCAASHGEGFAELVDVLVRARAK